MSIKACPIKQDWFVSTDPILPVGTVLSSLGGGITTILSAPVKRWFIDFKGNFEEIPPNNQSVIELAEMCSNEYGGAKSEWCSVLGKFLSVSQLKESPVLPSIQRSIYIFSWFALLTIPHLFVKVCNTTKRGGFLRKLPHLNECTATDSAITYHRSYWTITQCGSTVSKPKILTIRNANQLSNPLSARS